MLKLNNNCSNFTDFCGNTLYMYQYSVQYVTKALCRSNENVVLQNSFGDYFSYISENIKT